MTGLRRNIPLIACPGVPHESPEGPLCLGISALVTTYGLVLVGAPLSEVTCFLARQYVYYLPYE